MRRLLHLGLVLAGALLLAWPAIGNGYPLVYFDTAAYLDGAFQWQFSPSRPVGYSLFLLTARASRTLWTPVVLQALVTSLLAQRAGLAALRTCRAPLVPAAAALAAGALLGGAKYASWVMPDVFTSWLFLGGVLFLVSPLRWDRIGGAGAVAAASLVHVTHVPLALATLAAMTTAIVATHGRAAPLVRRAAILALVALACIPAAALVRRACHAPGPALGAHPAFLVQRLLSEGLLVETLDRDGVARHWKLLSYRDRIAEHAQDPREWYLWGEDSPLRSTDGWTDEAMIREQRAIVAQALRRHAGAVARMTLAAAWRQLWLTDAQEGIDRWSMRPVEHRIDRDLPAEGDAFRLAAEESRRAPRTVLFPTLTARLHVAAMLASLVLALACAARGRTTMASILATLLAFLCANALLVGFGSAVLGRYQGRGAWLLPWAVLLGAWNLAAGKDERTASSTLIA